MQHLYLGSNVKRGNGPSDQNSPEVLKMISRLNKNKIIIIRPIMMCELGSVSPPCDPSDGETIDGQIVEKVQPGLLVHAPTEDGG